MSRYISIKKTAELMQVSDKTVRRKIISNRDILNERVDKPIVQAKKKRKKYNLQYIRGFYTKQGGQIKCPAR